MTRSVLVTGHLGYVGRHVVRALSERGWAVSGCDRQEGDDVRDGAFAWRLDHFDAVVHLAALAHAGESVRRPLAYWGHNLGSTQALLSALVCRGFKGRLVFASSLLAGYPDSSPYAATKHACEGMVRASARAHGFSAVTLRLANVAGGGDRTPGRLMVELGNALRDGTPFALHGGHGTPDGTCVRDYVHALDVAHAFALALEAPAGPRETLLCEVGTGHGASARQVAALMREESGLPLELVEAASRPGDVPYSVADPEPAAALLGWRAEIGLRHVVRDAWAFAAGAKEAA